MFSCIFFFFFVYVVIRIVNALSCSISVKRLFAHFCCHFLSNIASLTDLFTDTHSLLRLTNAFCFSMKSTVSATRRVLLTVLVKYLSDRFTFVAFYPVFLCTFTVHPVIIVFSACSLFSALL